MDDVARLQAALGGVEPAADRQAWADRQPWRAASHVWAEGPLVVVDLHDLGVRLALQAVRLSAERAHELDSGAICFVTGVGRHSVGKAKLPSAVAGELNRIAADSGWEWRRSRNGRLVLIVDPSRAPAVATGQLGWAFWLLVAALVAAAVFACLGLPLLGR